MTQKLIPIDQPTNKFDFFLEIKGNQRIIFSGIYGSGKTHFLTQFFEESEQKKRHNGTKKYNIFHLFPINYSVSKNEDIFENIKYDILGRLLNYKECIDPKIENSLQRYFQLNSLIKKTPDIISPLLNFIPNNGDTLSAIYTGLTLFINQIEDATKKVNLELKQNQITTFFDEIENIKGSIFEFDIYTQLITQILELIKTNSNAENVLIIDDLDRVDPEHIFRLLNVFSAHFDLKAGDNKFGFDKIIVVCDIDNIRRIFNNRYGADVEFTGYIDKFYSIGIFQFENHEAIASNLAYQMHHLKLISIEDPSLLTINEFIKNSKNINTCKFIFKGLIDSNAINLRKLFLMSKFPLPYHKDKINYKGTAIYDWQLPILFIIRFLMTFYETQEDLLFALDKASKSNINLGQNDKDLPLLLLPLLDIENNNLIIDSVRRYDFNGLICRYQLCNIEIYQSIYYAQYYDLIGTHGNGNTNSPTDLNQDKDISEFGINFFKYLKMTTEVAVNYNLLKKKWDLNN